MLSDTITALSTPAAESAVGVVRLSGPSALSIASRCFRGRSDISVLNGHSVLTGTFFDPQSGAIIDRGVITVFRAPASYTGEDTVEFSLHGNPLILRRALELLIRLGARAAAPGEFTERAFLNGKLDLTQAEAVDALIRAHSEESLSAAQAQLSGVLSGRLSVIHAGLLDILAQVEAAIDHSDLDERFYDSARLTAELQNLMTDMAALLDTAQTGRMALSGIRVAIAGRPNAGKSSIVNWLLREDRVIVSDIPGTTRDVVEAELNMRGVTVRLYDTAGLRADGDVLENMGMERTRRALYNADWAWIAVDSSVPLDDETKRLLEEIRGSGKPALLLLTKSDLQPRLDIGSLQKAGWMEQIAVSAHTGLGLSVLEQAVRDFFDQRYQGRNDGVLLTNARQAEGIRNSLAALAESVRILTADGDETLLAHSLRQSRKALEEITGQTSDDDLLDRIFSRFCIGK